ncbi:MAG: hypothetical protein WDN08_17420 [Rhizomicrobium sp.]
MNARALAALLLAAALAGCVGKTPPPPVAPPAPPPLCKASEAAAVAFKDVQPALAGKCVKTRGLAMRSLLYENGEAYARRQRAPMLALLWQTQEPAALKTHPQFVEVTGRLFSCMTEKSRRCAMGASLGIEVADVKIIPTAMD